MPRFEISPCSRARKLRRVGPSVAERERVEEILLRRQHEAAELDEVDAVVAVVVVRIAEQPAGAAGDGSGGLGRDVLGREQIGVPGHRADDQVFEAALGRVGGHASTGSSSSTSGSSARLDVDLVERLRLVDLVRQPRRGFADVELAGDDVGDQAGAVLAEQSDLAAALGGSLVSVAHLTR